MFCVVVFVFFFLFDLLNHYKDQSNEFCVILLCNFFR